jgi:hypothetical protein
VRLKPRNFSLFSRKKIVFFLLFQARFSSVNEIQVGVCLQRVGAAVAVAAEDGGAKTDTLQNPNKSRRRSLASKNHFKRRQAN